jgi:hypothetical protein
MAEVVSLESWLAHVFDQPDDFREYNDLEDGFGFEIRPERRLELMTETFERSGKLLARFSDGQINQALWRSVVGMGSEYIHAIKDESVPWEMRRRAVWSFVPLFEQVMAKRCTETLSHRDERPASPLNAICYMWWDSAPICSTRTIPGDSRLDNECLAVMERILRIPHVACQESALHGLGEWAYQHKDEVVKIIDEFLNREPNLRDDLIGYAEAAKTGCIE